MKVEQVAGEKGEGTGKVWYVTQGKGSSRWWLTDVRPQMDEGACLGHKERHGDENIQFNLQHVEFEIPEGRADGVLAGSSCVPLRHAGQVEEPLCLSCLQHKTGVKTVPVLQRRSHVQVN